MTSRDPGRTPPPAWLDRGRIPCLDGLRAVSIALVIAEHTVRPDGLSAITRHFIGNIGFIGVSAFFTLSGFLITLLLVREHERSGRTALGAFYRRRALRILPAYVTYLLALLALTAAGVVVMTTTDWSAALTYTMNFVAHPTWEVGHLWSLSVEEQFYLVWPLLFVLLGPRRAVPVLAGYLVLAPIARTVMLVRTGSIETIEQTTLLHIDAIASGSLLALLSTNRRLVERLSPAPDVAARIIVLAVGCLALSYSVEGLAPFQGRYFNETIRYSVDATALGAIVWCAPFAATTALGRLLESRPLTTGGALSYSLYLWQQPFLNPHSSRWFTMLPVSLLLAVSAAVASYRLVELPFLRLKDATGDRPTTRPAHAVGMDATLPTNG